MLPGASGSPPSTWLPQQDTERFWTGSGHPPGMMAAVGQLSSGRGGFVAEHVLVAEDDPGQAELIRMYLQREGFEVEVVGDGNTALARAEARRPDLALLDIMMPGVDG